MQEDIRPLTDSGDETSYYLQQIQVLEAGKALGRESFCFENIFLALFFRSSFYKNVRNGKAVRRIATCMRKFTSRKRSFHGKIGKFVARFSNYNGSVGRDNKPKSRSKRKFDQTSRKGGRFGSSIECQV